MIFAPFINRSRRTALGQNPARADEAPSAPTLTAALLSAAAALQPWAAG